MFYDASAKHDEQADGDHDCGGNIAKPRINRRRDGGRQVGIQYTFDAETEPSNNPPHGINDCGDSGVGCTNHGQSLLDRADACLLQVLIGPG